MNDYGFKPSLKENHNFWKFKQKNSNQKSNYFPAKK